MILGAARKPTSKWKVIETSDQYRKCFTEASAQTQRQFMIVTRHGEDIGDIGELGGTELTKETFMESIQRVDVHRTRGTV